VTDFSRLRSALEEKFKSGIVNLHVRRGNQLHFQIACGDVPVLAELLRAHFGAELMLMVANDRRADKNAFEMHYLFANNRENWFAHATANLPSCDPTIPSLATFTYPASRFEREIKDLFGIEATGHPDRRSLVRHAFWPEDYIPLRKGSALPEKFEDDGTPFPFLPVGG
jgi:Ni,Fe-hydrogenase III component G